MGRHAADWTAPGSPGPYDRGKAQVSAERAAQIFDRLVEPHRAALRAYVLRLTEGDEAIADSVLKETLYRLAQQPWRYPQHPPAVRPWLVLTVHNVLRDGERHAPAGLDDRPYSVVQDVRKPGPAPPTPAATVAVLMKDLAPADRELVVELVYRGVSLEAAAAERGVPVETIKSRLYAAMRTLRAALAKERNDPAGTGV
ncbi:sigma factor-like helix-turn-helix DNA-binding protein [Phytohabitans rumicis]|uniref:RNA polymerase sigma factor n=1 Tax=Phytohabitans rumicis TaxID=1076125 RepID=A0A6V8L7K8_9ACTN|nr:sigma factor-like helix-turn-helix DNA-binding protein [Phytohabitans rumicis]GFJ89987.1 RNA polymerase sigma factor [Phytohabitans rumicis]